MQMHNCIIFLRELKILLRRRNFKHFSCMYCFDYKHLIFLLPVLILLSYLLFMKNIKLKLQYNLIFSLISDIYKYTKQ